MTKRIDRLERAGLVERRRDAHDGRGRVVALTARGREVIDAAYTEHIANEHRLVAMIGEERAGQARADPAGVAGGARGAARARLTGD